MSDSDVDDTYEDDDEVNGNLADPVDDVDGNAIDPVDDGEIPAANAQAVLSYLAKAVVSDPDAVTIEVEDGRRGGLSLNVHVADGDMGRVIGKRGRVAQSIRALVRAAVVTDQGLLEVGRVAKAHGLRGEVVVALSTDRAERVDPGSVLQTDHGPLEVLASRPHQHRWIVQFAGIDTREAAEALHGRVLRAEPVADEDALWVHELIGAEVLTPDGRTWGRVIEVEANPASDLLVLAGGVLVPTVFVVDESGLPDRVVVDPPAGLLDDVDEG